MLTQPAQSEMPQVPMMTAYHMISNLKVLLAGSASISVATMPAKTMPPNNEILMDSYTKLVVTNTPNGPAIFVGDSPLIPPTSVDALIKVYELPNNSNYLNQPVRLLKQSEGFQMNINLHTNQIVISGPMTPTGKIEEKIFNKYVLVNIMNNWTFGTLLFVDLGM